MTIQIRPTHFHVPNAVHSNFSPKLLVLYCTAPSNGFCHFCLDAAKASHSGSGIFPKIPNFNTFPLIKRSHRFNRSTSVSPAFTPPSPNPSIPPGSKMLQEETDTYFPQVLQKYLFSGVPLKVLVSAYIFKFASPAISNFEFSIMRFAVTAERCERTDYENGTEKGKIHDPGVFLQFIELLP
jgi:hypothetical protein